MFKFIAAEIGDITLSGSSKLPRIPKFPKLKPYITPDLTHNILNILVVPIYNSRGSNILESTFKVIYVIYKLFPEDGDNIEVNVLAAKFNVILYISIPLSKIC
jgi:hypothetical protein